MAHTDTLKRSGFGETMRMDVWWLTPAAVFTGFATFIVYSTWAAFQGNHYTFGPYLSPFYSPEIWGDSPHAWFGPKPGWWPSFIPYSPALLILWAPGGFRFTCYYYRGAYYKAFWADPPACSVGEPRTTYLGEAKLPLIIQNLHRYFFYIAAIFIVLLWHDVWKSLWWSADGKGPGDTFGIGLGTIILAINTTFLSCYTFGCHSFRHLIGGVVDRFSGRPVRYNMWKCATCLNGRHMMWAWFSLFSVGFSDLYVRMCSMGIWHDFRLI